MVDDSCITLYDTASRTGKPWNVMGSRARFALNFKGLPFKTIWLEYPEIEPTMRDLGAAPTFLDIPGPKQWFYTIPVIVDPGHLTPTGEPTVVSDSWAIVEYLDKVYPTPNMLLPPGTKALQSLFDKHISKNMLQNIVPIWIANFLGFLNDESRPYFRQTREAYWKKPLEEICPKGSTEWEESWDRTQKMFSDLATLLDKNAEGAMFVMGDRAIYADLIVASILETMCLVFPDEWEQKVKQWDGGRWGNLQIHCAEWSGMH